MTENGVLGSWKEIAGYLEKEIRTCWRWEKELGLPVHRIDSQSSRSRVFAYKSEIDAWLKQKANNRGLQPKSVWAQRKLLLGVVGLALLGLVPALMRWTGHGRSSAPQAGRLMSIAMLPFSDAAGPEHEAYYAEGITQEIIQSLRAYGRLAVIPIPLSSKDSNLLGKPEALGKELGLDYVLRGSLTRREQTIYLVVEFLRAKDERLLWTSRYKEPLKNLAAIRADIQSRVCDTLGLKPNRTVMSASDLAAIPTALTLENYVKGNFVLAHMGDETRDPWLLYHQGRFYGEQYTSADNELAINLFRQALDSDPAYAPAYIGLANCYSNYIALNWDFDIQWLNKAEELLNKAQALSPDLPEYYGALLEVLLLREFIFDQKQEAGILSLAGEGLKRFPNDQQLNSLVGIYHYRRYGRDGQEPDLARAAECKKRAFWLNPYAFNNIVYAEMLLIHREFDKAEEVCTLAAKLDASLAARYFLGEVYYYRGELDRSRALFQSFDAVPRLRLWSLYYLAMIAARQGDGAGAKKILNEISLLSPGEFRFFPDKLKLASAYLGLGDAERGLSSLAAYLDKIKTASDRFINYHYIDLDKNFDRFRNDPRFLEIMKVKESPSWLRVGKSR